jgi:dienelactone hydrolase
VLTTSGAQAAHSILINGKLVATAPLTLPDQPEVGESYEGLYRAPKDLAQAVHRKRAEPIYLTVPIEVILQGENRIELTNDALSTDSWRATDVRLEVFGYEEAGLVALPALTHASRIVRTGDAAAAAVRSVIEFTNDYDGSQQEAALQVPDGYQAGTAVPLVVAVHGRSGTMSGGLDLLDEAANARGWLLAAPQMHGAWVVPEECTVYPNDCQWEDKVVAGTTSETSEPRPGAYAYASVQAQYDIVGTVRYVVEQYDVDLDRIYLYGVSMGGQTVAVTAAKFPHLFAAVLDNIGPTDASVWYDEQLALYGAAWNSDVRAMRKECHAAGTEQTPAQNPFCYQRRSGLLYARNYVSRDLVAHPAARPPISITHGVADLVVPVHHARDLRDAINGFGPGQPVSVYEDTVISPTCPPYHHCYGPEPEAILDYFAPLRLRKRPTLVKVAADMSKTFYWLDLAQSGGDHWSFVEAEADQESSTLTINVEDENALTLGVNLLASSLPLPELSAMQQPGLGFPAATYLVRGSASDGLVDHTSGVLDVNVGAGQSTVTISALAIDLWADPATIVPDPQAVTQISLNVRDSLGNPVPDGVEVNLETSWGTFPNGGATYTVQTVGGQAAATLTVGQGSDLARVEATCRLATASVDVGLTAHTTETQLVEPGDAPLVDFPTVGCSLDCSSGPGGTVTVVRYESGYPSPPGGVRTMTGYWDLSSTFDGPFVCDLTFQYDEGDLDDAVEGDLAGAARWDADNASWEYLAGAADTDANTLMVPSVSAFSSWLLLTATPPRAVENLGGVRAGSDLQLAWSAVTEDILGNGVTPAHYVVYRRADEPYFVPTPGDVIATPTSPSFTDVGVLGDPAHNYYYLVSAADNASVESAPSNRLGAFDYALFPATAAGERVYNLIAVPLEMASVIDADSLAAYGGSGVYMILRHDAAIQAIEWRLPGLAGTHFAVAVGDAVYLYLDETAPSVFSLVGNVPGIGTVSYDLARPDPDASCAYNFISVPLHRDDLGDADALAADIGGVHSVSRYSADAQDLTWRLPGVSGDNFAVRAGYPYIVCLDSTAPPTWP